MCAKSVAVISLCAHCFVLSFLMKEAICCSSLSASILCVCSSVSLLKSMIAIVYVHVLLSKSVIVAS